MTRTPLAWEEPNANHLAMKQAVRKFPFYAWINLLGLEIPIAAVLWSFFFCKIAEITTVPSSIYQFLFVSAWSAIMVTRLIHVSRNPNFHLKTPSLLFVRSNGIILLVLSLIAAIYGVWLMFFQLSEGIISYAIIPCLFFFLFLNKGQNKRIEPSMSAYGAMAFASAVPIPAFFYSLSHSVASPFYFPNPQILFSPSFWILTGLACLISFCRLAYRQYDCDRVRKFIPLLTGALTFFIVYKMAFLKTGDSEFFLLGSIGAGIAMIYSIHQVAHRFSSEAFHAISWLALIIPIPLAALANWCFS